MRWETDPKLYIVVPGVGQALSLMVAQNVAWWSAFNIHFNIISNLLSNLCDLSFENSNWWYFSRQGKDLIDAITSFNHKVDFRSKFKPKEDIIIS